jgi:hypothetical protein
MCLVNQMDREEHRHPADQGADMIEHRQKTASPGSTRSPKERNRWPNPQLVAEINSTKTDRLYTVH